MLIQNKNKLKYRILTQIPTINQYDAFLFIGKKDKIERELKKEIEKLKKAGIDISVCPEYLDGLIEKHLAIIQSDIEESHRKNMRLIERAFARRRTDCQELIQNIALLEEEIAAAESEYVFMKEVFEKHNPLYRGILSLFHHKGTRKEENEEQEEENEKSI